uniref:Uncharacterized protein n=1 Tax=Anguilla anguilla TaxID=7936 RepID=A0A0E9T1V8_ANGAN
MSNRSAFSMQHPVSFYSKASLSFLWWWYKRRALVALVYGDPR